MEEIVGEIYDEKDSRSPFETAERHDYIKEVAPDVYNVDYRSTVSELGVAIGVNIPSSALYDTVGSVVQQLEPVLKACLISAFGANIR